MKTLNKIILAALIIISAVPCIAQNDSVYTYKGYEFDMTVYKIKKKLIASSNKIVNYSDTIEYSGISSILLTKDSARFIDYGKEIKLNMSEVSELSFKTGSNSWLGVLIGIPAGIIIGGLIGNAIDPPSKTSFGGAIGGCLLGALTGGLVGGFAAPSSYDNYQIKGRNNDERRNEIIKMLDSANIRYKNEL